MRERIVPQLVKWRDAPSNQNESIVAESFLHCFRNKTGLFATFEVFTVMDATQFSLIDVHDDFLCNL
ncbi:hypothetical protein CMV_012150 [Castanea mollissima]|uniref:Uncharacterized protein n=1 Tax=Castanea mollissima TaxID=60419 RepID=A0A8J4VNI5_9ROSI|nr:hypothetical protein CMV_012150 [Castanea mollissima]